MNSHVQIENRKGKLKLNDGVHKESADKLIEELDRLYGPAAVMAQMRIGDVVCSADDALEAVEVEINSPGGSVFEGNRIYNALRGMSARGVEITTTVNGLAASMGSVILMAGDKRQMTHGSRIMIHEASTIAWGDARVMRKNAELLESISSEIAGIYAERTGGDPSAIRDLMYAETWMTAEEAKENSFIHAIIKDGKQKEKNAAASTILDIRNAGGKSGGMSLLSRLFPGNDEAAKIESAIAENDSLRAEIESLSSKISALHDEIAGKDQTIAEHVASIAAKDEAITAHLATISEKESAIAERDGTIEKLNGELESAKNSSGKQAVETLASIGQPEPLNLETVESDPVAEYLAAVESGDRAKRQELFAKHKTEILAYYRKTNK